MKRHWTSAVLSQPPRPCGSQAAALFVRTRLRRSSARPALASRVAAESAGAGPGGVGRQDEQPSQAGQRMADAAAARQGGQTQRCGRCACRCDVAAGTMRAGHCMELVCMLHHCSAGKDSAGVPRRMLENICMQQSSKPTPAHACPQHAYAARPQAESSSSSKPKTTIQDLVERANGALSG